MERSDLIKLLVLFIAVMFVLSMFYQFGKTPQSTTSTTTQTIVGTTSTKCNVTAFATEITVDPWTNETAAIAENLKAEGKIAYTNIVGRTGILLLPNGANISDVRSAFSDLDVKMTAESSCNVIGIVNFTLENGTLQPQAPGSVTLNLDPYTQVGDELYLKIVADISNLSIVSMQSTLIPQVSNSLTNATIECSDSYQIAGLIPWDGRNINVSDIAYELNISNNSISYQKSDVVLFNQSINSSQLASIKMKNLSYVYMIVSQGLEANTTNQSLITSVTDEIGVNDTFEPSPIVIAAEGNQTMTNVMNLIQKIGSNITEGRGCTLKLDKMINVDEKQMLVPSSRRQLKYFLLVSDIPTNSSTIQILGNASYIGRVVSSFDVIKVG